MRDARSLHGARALEIDLGAPEVVEQPGATAEEDRGDMDLQFVDQPCLQVLLDDTRAAGQGDVLPPAAFRAWSRADSMPSVTKLKVVPPS
jgi:hypothetical protein